MSLKLLNFIYNYNYLPFDYKIGIIQHLVGKISIVLRIKLGSLDATSLTILRLFFWLI